MENQLMEKVVSLCKRRGFVFPGSDIYGGLANTWDYGPYGIALKKGVKDLWWKTFVEDRDDMVGLDAAILMNPRTWEASGHVSSFSDPLIDCKKCKNRQRGDHLVEKWWLSNFKEEMQLSEIKRALLENQEGSTYKRALEKFQDAGTTLEVMREIVKGGDRLNTDLGFISAFVTENKVPCPECDKCDWTEAKQFNLMFKTKQGVVEGEQSDIYLRPETAQGIFVNFKNVVDTCRVRLPFGIGQIGKAFRNEITPGNFTFRTREFEQMEIEYFCHPSQKKELYEEWKAQSKAFFTDLLGVRAENLRFREHGKDELSHYSSMTFDVEYRFPFGKTDENETWGELQGLADRGDFDLSQHEKFSGKDLKYRDPQTNEVFLPHVIEPSFGCDRTVLTVLIDAYNEERLEDGSERVVMKFKPTLSPVQVAVFPLLKNKPELIEKAKEIHRSLKPNFRTEWDDNGNIGKRYRRQDEIGTPFCVTVDFETLEDGAVTVRDRDSMKQDRVKINQLNDYLSEKLKD